MANVTAKTSSNIFYKARCEAATHNEQLSSREGAADYMSIDRGRLYRIESGIAIPYPEEIRLMADLYNAPELENYFCRTMCPLGCEMPKVELANLDRLTVRTLSVFRKIGKTKEMLLDITSDGVIDESEKPELDEVVKNLEEVEEIAQSMRLWIKKNTAFADLRGQLEQWCQRWCLQLEPQQSPLQCELEHRFPLRSAFKSDAADLMGVQSVQRCKGFRLLCSRKKM